MMANNDIVAISYDTLLAAERELYSRSFKDFAKRAWREIDPSELVENWHFDVVCDTLQGVAEGNCTRLLVNIPPGFAKSMLLGVLFPAWMWTHTPAWRAISTSHSQEQAIRDTRKSRDLIRSEWYQARWPIDFKEDQDQKSRYENEHRGFRIAKPFTSLTGERGNCIIIDDPHSVDGARSEAERTSTIETFLEAVPNRLNDLRKDAIIVIMQRLHEQDVAGTILDRPELGYDLLCLPMEFDGTTSIPKWLSAKDPRKKDGQLLFPAKFPKEEVNKIKASMGPIAYAGQYQQRPSPREAGELDRDWFKRFDLRGGRENYPGMNFYMTSDHASSAHGDYNVFIMWGVDAMKNCYAVEVFRKRCKMDEALGIQRDNDCKLRMLGSGALPMVKRWKPLAFFPENDPAWQSTEGLFRQAMRESSVFVTLKPQSHARLGDKVAKVQPFVAIASLGQVHLPNGPVGDAMLDEFVRFPNAKHDDQVDAAGMIGYVIDQVRGFVPVNDPHALLARDDYKGGPPRAANDSDSFFA